MMPGGGPDPAKVYKTEQERLIQGLAITDTARDDVMMARARSRLFFGAVSVRSLEDVLVASSGVFPSSLFIFP